jgi:hypothetical protein
MATRKVTTSKKQRKAKPPQLPRNLLDAVNQNWEIVEQLSSWRFKGSCARDGFFRLKKEGYPKTLMVSYRALYELGSPYFLEDVET